MSQVWIERGFERGLEGRTGVNGVHGHEYIYTLSTRPYCMNSSLYSHRNKLRKQRMLQKMLSQVHEKNIHCETEIDYLFKDSSTAPLKRGKV